MTVSSRVSSKRWSDSVERRTSNVLFSALLIVELREMLIRQLRIMWRKSTSKYLFAMPDLPFCPTENTSWDCLDPVDATYDWEVIWVCLHAATHTWIWKKTIRPLSKEQWGKDSKQKPIAQFKRIWLISEISFVVLLNHANPLPVDYAVRCQKQIRILSQLQQLVLRSLKRCKNNPKPQSQSEIEISIIMSRDRQTYPEHWHFILRFSSHKFTCLAVLQEEAHILPSSLLSSGPLWQYWSRRRCLKVGLTSNATQSTRVRKDYFKWKTTK